MEYHVQLTQVGAQPTAVVRFKAQRSELSRVVPACCGEVWNYLRAAGAPRPGRHVALYWDGEINLEVGVEMDQPFVAGDRVVSSTIPSGLVATTVHLGTYDRLSDAHEAIRQWRSAHGYSFAGPSWEIYGHWNDDPAQLRTDIFYLLKDAADQSVTQTLG
jgi:effector-binding domain-containing protein